MTSRHRPKEPATTTADNAEEALERMKALTRRVLAAPKGGVTPKRKHRPRKRR